ncbi:MobA/MobL family protein [Pseudomonas aeruginosa]|nr:MobA/MobL family protein [Pseudomonas aeruginosa]
MYHASTKPISRSGGRSSVAAAAYRAGCELVDERTGLVHNYTRRAGVVSAEILTPDGGSADRSQLWNAAEQAEKRKDGRTAREWIVALPSELDAEQRADLARAFGRELVERYGVAVDVAVHEPDSEGDQRNHHAHVLTTTRQVHRAPDGSLRLGEKASIEQSDKARRERGLGPAADEVKAIRQLWEETANRALERAGSSERIDHRSLAAQGIDREATTHLGPVASEMERRGRASDRGDGNRQVAANNAERVRLVAEIHELHEARAKAELARRLVPDPAPAPAQIHDLAAEREQRGLPAVEQPAPAKRENEAQRVERLLGEATAAKRQWDDLVRERQAIQQRQDKGQPAYVAPVVELGRKAWEARNALEAAREDRARQEQRIASRPNPLTDWATRLGHRLKVAQAERKERQARKAFAQHPDYKRARAWNERNKADQARLARPAGRDAPQIDLEITEARARAEAAQRVADRAAADPRELLRQMDAALLDRQNALAELPRDALAEHQLAHDRQTVRALRQQIDQPDRPSAEALAEILERHQMQARHWQGVAEGVTRERTRRVLQERQRAQQALREAVEREQGIEDAQGYELARIEREERRIEQLLADVDGFDQGKPKPLPVLAEERQRLDEDRRRLEEVPSWAEEARAEAEQAQHHRPSPFRPW